ncbi:glucose 1,6-bisphosphate synthase [Colias croceus]|uniref:glucose 1,6-bisphosphate synthase n=1 Tax=Colias crocea TaxID=72248 RepID=UPI001E27F103|nr:glucose 1,6-bisphosphate synthase [Colias croceus]
MSACKSGDVKLDTAVESWLKLDKNPKTREEVLDDIKNARWDKLKKTMLKRQKFGTAGLRGRMGAGYMCMNDVVVLQTAQGLCSYLKKVCSKRQLSNGLVVGFDGRYNSKRFAELTAKVFVSSSIPVYLFSSVCPTPLVSYATILYGTAGGVMVTASHNPREDNGYKVYWGNGSQVIAPHDDNILDEILLCLEIPEDHWDIANIRNHDLVTDCQQDVTTRYMKYIHDSLSSDVREQNKTAAIPIVYSAMHGVGYEYVADAFKAAQLKLPISVQEQQYPNPDFPTVKFPNPEEKECLELSKQLAEIHGTKLVLVNDPDADRLAVAEFDNRSWKVFTGNEMGTLLGWWMLHQFEANNTTGEDRCYLLASFVSSKMLSAVCRGKARFVETLTGFKWMGNATLLLKEKGRVPLFAFEEAIGYMCNSEVPDKDGVSAAVQVASLASHLYSQGTTLADHLQALYRDFGYHVSYNGYFLFDDPAVVQKIFNRIRKYQNGGYPKKVGQTDVVYINDFTAGVQIPKESDDDSKNKVEGTGLDLPYTSGEMIMFKCASGLNVVFRTSGTEPKLKYYSELAANKGQGEEEAKAELESIMKEFINELIQPKENGLIG